MTTEQKLTDWFPADVKPVRKGVYATRYVGDSDSGYSTWTGTHWGCEYFSFDYAKQYRDSDGRGHQDKNWRGLSSNPKAKA